MSAVPRPCGSRTPHVPHPWDRGLRWCGGIGKYAESTAPAPLPADRPECGYTYTGPTGIVWVCRGLQHPHNDPQPGQRPKGHAFAAVPRAS